MRKTSISFLMDYFTLTKLIFCFAVIIGVWRMSNKEELRISSQFYPSSEKQVKQFNKNIYHKFINQ